MKTLHKIAMAGAVTALLATGGGLPAYASGTVSKSCTATQEVCRVTHNSVTGNLVRITTSFPAASGSAHYEVSKAVYGATLCSGTMSMNTTFTCNIGTYRGQVTFTFYKGQNPVGTISLNG